jgi:hypothetical protein
MSIREPSMTPSQASVRTAARPLAPGREPSGQRERCLPRHWVQIICTSDELSGIGRVCRRVGRIDNRPR